jgi:lysine biosynthesis protein LysW
MFEPILNPKEEFKMQKRCPTCGSRITIYYDHDIGDEVYCEECDREFQLVSFKPFRLEPLDEFAEYYFEEDEY